jgi:hypothetical protein
VAGLHRELALARLRPRACEAGVTADDRLRDRHGSQPKAVEDDGPVDSLTLRLSMEEDRGLSEAGVECPERRQVRAARGHARHIKNADLDLIVYGRDTAAGMNSLARIVRNSTMTRFGWAMEDVVR